MALERSMTARLSRGGPRQPFMCPNQPLVWRFRRIPLMDLAEVAGGHYNERAMPPVTGLIVDVVGFLTGTALYVMLVAMVWRERAGDGAPFFSRRGRLPLLTGLCGMVWNVGALIAFGMQIAGDGRPAPLVVAVTFSALGFLPAVVVH